jgi:hypothetical protein
MEETIYQTRLERILGDEPSARRLDTSNRK